MGLAREAAGSAAPGLEAEKPSRCGVRPCSPRARRKAGSEAKAGAQWGGRPHRASSSVAKGGPSQQSPAALVLSQASLCLSPDQAKMTDLCPASAPFFGFMGAAVALIFASACCQRIDRRPRLPSHSSGSGCRRPADSQLCLWGSLHEGLAARPCAPLGRARGVPRRRLPPAPPHSHSLTSAPSAGIGVSHRAHRLGGCVRHCQVGRRRVLDGCDEARPRDEVDHPRCHGGCAGYLRSYHCGHHCQRRCAFMLARTLADRSPRHSRARISSAFSPVLSSPPLPHAPLSSRATPPPPPPHRARSLLSSLAAQSLRRPAGSRSTPPSRATPTSPPVSRAA